MAISKPQNILLGGFKDGVKTYITYDALNRMEFIYEAKLDAKTGDPCLVTQYQYIGSSNRIQKSREFVGTWDSSYDI